MSFPPCDQEVFDKGEVVFITNTIRSVDMEAWICKVREDCGERIDWHQFGGRPVVKALGNLHRVRKALIMNRKMHDEGYKKAILELQVLDWSEEKINEMIWNIWKYNGTETNLSSYMCMTCHGICLPENHK